jgi:hypothetical protein
MLAVWVPIRVPRKVHLHALPETRVMVTNKQSATCRHCGRPIFSPTHPTTSSDSCVWRSPSYRLVSRDKDHLAQYSEYEVILGGEVIGQVVGSAHNHYNVRLGRRTVWDRTWSAITVDGRGTSQVGTRKEAVQDLLRLIGRAGG